MESLLSEKTVILEALLPLHPKSTPLFQVRVLPSSVSFTQVKDGSGNRNRSLHRSTSLEENKTNTINFEDIIGCDCMKGKKTSDSVAFLNIYSYQHVKKLASKKTSRKRQVVTLMFVQTNDFEQNYAAAFQWKVVLSNLIRGLEIEKLEDLSITLQPPSPMKLLVLVNPFSGPGKALTTFQERIVPLFAEAGIEYQLIVTEYAGHAKELVKQLHLEEWYGIVIVSGDGLIFEVVNGLMERPDCEKAIKMPLGVLPGGSGNALCCSLLYQAKEPYLDNCALHATFMIAKHTVTPMDLVAVDLCSGRRLYSFLAIGWGMIADVDIESEKYRNLGNSRFALGAVMRIVGLRKYRGRLSFLPAKGSCLVKRHHSQQSRIPDDSVIGTYQRSLSTLDAFGGCIEAEGKTATSKNEPVCEAQIIGEPVSRNSGSVAKSFSQKSDVDCTGETLGRDELGYLTTPLLVPLSEPVPSHWVTIEDDFIIFVAIYQTHIAQDFLSTPDSKLNDGIIYLIFMRGNVSRIRLLQLLNVMQSGQPPPDDPNLDVIKVHAFRLDPLGNTGNLTVDGELVEYGPIQAQVMPSMANVMTLRKAE